MLDRPFSTLNTNQFREQICGVSPLSPSQFEQNVFNSQNHPWKMWTPQPQQQYNAICNCCSCPQSASNAANFCSNPSVMFTFRPQPLPAPAFCAPPPPSHPLPFIVPPSNFQLEMLRFQQMRMDEIENRNAIEQFCRQFQTNPVPFQFKFRDYGTLLPETFDRNTNTLRDSGNQTHFCCDCSRAEKASGEESKPNENSEEKNVETVKTEEEKTTDESKDKDKDEEKKEEVPPESKA